MGIIVSYGLCSTFGFFYSSAHAVMPFLLLGFGIGASSSLPALRSFCMYASLGILTIFFFQITWFVALLTIDEQRIEKRRNACFCCFVHRRNEATTDEPSNIRASSFTSKCFQMLAKAQTLPLTKTCILTVTSMLLGFGIYG